MDESDEDKVLLEDEARAAPVLDYASSSDSVSMDEMYEIEGDLAARHETLLLVSIWRSYLRVHCVPNSVDTNASPAKPLALIRSSQRMRFDDDLDQDESDSEQSEMFGGSSSSEEDERDEHTTTATTKHASLQSVSSASESITILRPQIGPSRGDCEEEDEEPPEIPGSPLRTTPSEGPATASQCSRLNRQGKLETSGDEQRQPSVDILHIHRHDDSDNGEDGNESDYETKDAEAPRVMEFHASSSESDSDDSPSDRIQRPKASSQREYLERPKTAAKVLEQYRDVLPLKHYEQIVQEAPTSPVKQAKSAVAQANGNSTKQERIEPRANNTTASPNKYKVRVPREIEELFQLVDAYTPEAIDIPTHLHPFIPEYVPAIGVPFDGIQIPRPDGKPDPSGVAFVREPCAQSNAAELELLLSADAKSKRKRRVNVVARVHSIEDAAHRPREIDQWIASVAKVQATKPPRHVSYKKPMPSETSLMELWPEEFELFLTTTQTTALPISTLDVSLPELVRIVCGILDIPVYDGMYVHSLHALFSLYNEVLLYEKEMLSRGNSSR